jgi:DNA-3-methyladenine glycosylase I
VAMAKSLKAIGFKWTGPTVCYAFMQAVGMINDHVTSCHRYHACG